MDQLDKSPYNILVWNLIVYISLKLEKPYNNGQILGISNILISRVQCIVISGLILCQVLLNAYFYYWFIFFYNFGLHLVQTKCYFRWLRSSEKYHLAHCILPFQKYICLLWKLIKSVFEGHSLLWCPLKMKVKDDNMSVCLRH